MGGQVLRCFYCGRKSTARWDGQLRKFDCANCEATNYLDEVWALDCRRLGSWIADKVTEGRHNGPARCGVRGGGTAHTVRASEIALTTTYFERANDAAVLPEMSHEPANGDSVSGAVPSRGRVGNPRGASHEEVPGIQGNPGAPVPTML